MNQEALRSRLLIELDCVTLDARAVAGPLSASQLGWGPGNGAWSIASTLEHLIVSHDAYLTRMRGLIYARNAPHADNGHADWEPSLAGWLLVGSMRSKRKLPAPSAWRPEGEARADVLRVFLERQEQVVTFLRAASALDWTRVRLSSPRSRFIRLNLGDAFMVLTVHAQRHIKQMERVRALEAFPAA